MKIIELGASVTASNDADARELRESLRRKGVLLVNVMSAAGSGKTTLLSRIIRDMQDVRIGVLEADLASSVDAERIAALGARAIQVHTDGMCHMDAGMTAAAVDALDAGECDLLFLENVGNLICPAEYDTGAGKNLMLLSVPEGDDKPLKYPLMFEKSDAVVLTKTDALPYFTFDTDRCVERIRRLNPTAGIFPVSAKTGDNMEALETWLRRALDEWRKQA